MGKTHELKTHLQPFQDIEYGLKKFEFRKNDRNYEVGDNLRLMEYDHHNDIITGRTQWARVDYILHGGQYGIPDGFCIMSITTF